MTQRIRNLMRRGALRRPYVAPGGAPEDLDPDPFTFDDVVNATPSTVYTSNIITIAGITAAAPATISTSGGVGEYRKNGGAWTSSLGSVVNGDTVQVRVTSASAAATAVAATLTIGGVSDTFTVTTAAAALRTLNAGTRTQAFTSASGVKYIESITTLKLVGFSGTVSRVKIVCTNWRFTGTNDDERGTAAARTIELLAVEAPDSVAGNAHTGTSKVQGLFTGDVRNTNSGQSVVIDAVPTTGATVTGGNAESDWINLPQPLPAGTEISVWAYSSSANTTQVCSTSGRDTTAVVDGTGAASTKDVCRASATALSPMTISPVSAGRFAQSGTGAFGGAATFMPVFLVLAEIDGKSLVIIGDSIGEGVAGDFPVNQRRGLIARNIPETIPVANFAAATATAQTVVAKSPNRRQYWNVGSTVVIQMGANDIGGGANASVMKTRQQALAADAAFRADARFIITTMTPRSMSSTDFFTTVAGQAAPSSTYKTNLTQYNQVVRGETVTVAGVGAVSGPIAGVDAVWDINSALAVDNINHAWKVPYANARVATVTFAGGSTANLSSDGVGANAFLAGDVGWGIVGGPSNSYLAARASGTAATAGRTFASGATASVGLGAPARDGLHPEPAMDLQAASVINLTDIQ